MAQTLITGKENNIQLTIGAKMKSFEETKRFHLYYNDKKDKSIFVAFASGILLSNLL